MSYFDLTFMSYAIMNYWSYCFQKQKKMLTRDDKMIQSNNFLLQLNTLYNKSNNLLN